MKVRAALKSARRILENKQISTLYHEARLRLIHAKSGAPLLIYQMGKVGSSSILDSLKSARFANPIFHIHFLNPDNIRAAEDRLRSMLGDQYNVNRWTLYESRFVIEHILQRLKDKIRLISLVREPVARNVSSFFQNLDLFIPDCAKRFEAGEINIAEITSCYLRDFHEHTYPLDWFDNEMRAVFGIDVYSSENLIIGNHKHSLYSRGDVELLLLRAEDIQEVASNALQDFLKIGRVPLKNANQARSKDYHRVYREFTSQLRLPDQYLRQMYESKYMKAFYSPSEAERYYSYWSRP